MTHIPSRISIKPRFLVRDAVKLYINDWQTMVNMMVKIDPPIIADMTDIIEVELDKKEN